MTLNGAIMQLVEMRENSMMPDLFKPYFDKVIETISECVEPSEIPQWIPCSERLPEPWDFVLVTDRRKDVRVCQMHYDSSDGWYDECDNWMYFSTSVIAWMPLPEPYKG